MRTLSFVLILMLAATPVAAFDRSLWQSPIISDKSGVTEILIERAPAGLFLRERLDPTKRYKLRVKGTGEPITMRLQIDDMAQEFLAAPLGVTDRTITGASRLELLFYSLKPASYSLERVEIEKCPECRTAEDLRRRILDEVPGVATKTGLERAILLMEWAANVADYTLNPKLIPPDFGNWPAEKMVYDFFDLDRGGVSCGGYSAFLQRILQMFGINSFTVNYGIPNSALTHVTVIVPHNSKFYVLDPTFNVTFMRKGRMLDLAQAIKILRTGLSSEIVIQEHGLERRDIIGYSPEAYPEICVRREMISAGMRKCRIGDSSFIAAFRRGEAHDWSAANVPLDNVFLLRLMLKGFYDVGPSIDPSARNRFIAMLGQYDIPFHSANLTGSESRAR